MYINISVDTNGNVFLSYETSEPVNRKKGNSLLKFIDNFTVIDIETTGFHQFSEIIEIGALKVEEGKVIAEFQSLVKPDDFIERISEDGYYLDNFIVKLTGITDNMLSIAPNPKAVLADFLEFIDDSILVAHNANFDINILYDTTLNTHEKILSNNFIDTLRISRKLFKEYKKHKLSYLAKELKLKHSPRHRALDDCYTTLNLYYACREKATLENIDFLKIKTGLKARNLSPENTDWFDEDHPLYEKNCVFTGTLTRMTRREAMQLVLNLGGKCSDGINKKTNYLIMGVQDYSKFTNGLESNKSKKARSLIEQGLPIQIISEDDFYELVFNIDLESR